MKARFVVEVFTEIWEIHWRFRCGKAPLDKVAVGTDQVAALVASVRLARGPVVLLVDDAELTPDYVTERIGTLMGDTAALDQMTTAAALAGHRDAARRVAQIALEVAGVATGSGLR